LEKDPTFSRAWTGIAKVWYFLADVYVKPLEAYPAAKEAALKAIALDEKDAEAHCYLSEAKRVLDWDLEGADEELKRALQLDPNSFYLDSVLAAAYREKGNFPEAIALYTKAQEATHLPSSGLAITYTRMGRHIDAQNILVQLLQAREKRYVSAPLIAAVSVALGDKEGAF